MYLFDLLNFPFSPDRWCLYWTTHNHVSTQNFPEWMIWYQRNNYFLLTCFTCFRGLEYWIQLKSELARQSSCYWWWWWCVHYWRLIHTSVLVSHWSVATLKSPIYQSVLQSHLSVGTPVHLSVDYSPICQSIAVPFVSLYSSLICQSLLEYHSSHLSVGIFHWVLFVSRYSSPIICQSILLSHMSVGAPTLGANLWSDVPLVVNTSRAFPHSRLITQCN